MSLPQQGSWLQSQLSDHYHGVSPNLPCCVSILCQFPVLLPVVIPASHPDIIWEPDSQDVGNQISYWAGQSSAIPLLKSLLLLVIFQFITAVTLSLSTMKRGFASARLPASCNKVNTWMLELLMLWQRHDCSPHSPAHTVFNCPSNTSRMHIAQ